MEKGIDRQPGTVTGCVITMAAIIVFGAAIRWAHIGAESLWLDEGASAGIARLPWSDFLAVLWHREGNMALYYLLLRGWMVMGSSDAWMRSLSAVFSVATIPFVFLVGCEVRSKALGFIAATLFAASPFAILYAQEARGYSLVALLLTIAAWALLRALKSGNQDLWAIFIGAMAASIYVHLFVVFVLAAQVSYMWRAGMPVPRIRRVLGVLTLTWMPMIAFVAIKKAGQLHWVPKLTFSRAAEALSQLSGEGWLAWIVLGLVIVAAGLSLGRRIRGPIEFLWLWLLVPVTCIVVASVFRPLLVPRFLILELPALLLIAALPLAEFPRALGVTVLAICVALGVQTQALAWKHPKKDDFRSATAYVLAHASPGDGILFDQALGRHAFEFYAGGKILMQVLSPAHGDRATYRDFEFDPPETLAWKLQAAPSTVWVVMNSYSENGKPDRYALFLMSLLQRDRFCESTAFHGVDVLRCSR